ncbi:Bug family tripartite tricarboxylate transporter substrate binding protein [Hydrogenophaga sp. BPS33]|uniref:Bug family tripartite tricarboxylate transporter substrate binding protein n=1 Tax=Hydrogenophaga sp. BPS33 TaxID=2651974 RepID=UPI00131F66DC|nr:tripartite tricarboxylate transporter substrate binding protein [Hydrogenophaga sp. BPS33]QHE86901.1 tripartite tricarboxylate transporter substrate binding protein [Hydrogenophaga sp. BPS33]
MRADLTKTLPLMTASALALAGGAAQADNFPSKPIRVIVSTSPGGLTDLVARTVGKLMGEGLGQSLVIDNRPGAGTLIGMSACAKAPADGYTLCLTDNQSLVFNPLLFTKLPYDAKTGFMAIGGVVRTPNDVIVAHPSVPAETFRGLMAHAKAKPEAVSFATWGPGSVPAIYYAWIARQNGVQMTPVPYKGSAPSFLAVNSGEVNLAFSSLALAKPAVEAGKLKMVAVTGTQRAPAFPQVPSLGEFNSDPGMGTFWGLYAPANTPAAVVSRLNAELNKAVTSPAFKAFAAQNYMEPLPGTPAQYASHLTQAQEQAARTFKEIGIQPSDAPSDTPAAGR